jgi:hypothetical protein
MMPTGSQLPPYLTTLHEQSCQEERQSQVRQPSSAPTLLRADQVLLRVFSLTLADMAGCESHMRTRLPLRCTTCEVNCVDCRILMCYILS